MITLTDKLAECQEYIDKLRREYIKTQVCEQERDALIGEINIEQRDVKGYHGREILELLQNADDAYQRSIDSGEKPDCELEVTISYIDGILTVSNTGTCFDKEGIKSIVQGNNSTKTGKYIGCKGTGFRSVLNWASEVRIHSGCFNVVFSKKIAEKIFDEIRDKPQIQKQLTKNPNLYIPMLSVPSNIDGCGRNDVTKIEIAIDSDKVNDDFSVSKQLNGIDLRILLFLPNISKIIVITENSHIVYSRTIVQGTLDKVSLQKIVDGNVTINESFYLFNKTIEKVTKQDNEQKDIRLAIAVPVDYSEFKPGNLYTYFPLMNTKSPFNCVLHATYDLGENRNTIYNSNINKKVFQEQLGFLIETANELVCNNLHDIAYRILVPVDYIANGKKFSAPFSAYGLEGYYFDLLAKQKILLTVNGVNISMKEQPRLITGSFPDVFVGEAFAKILCQLSAAGEALIHVITQWFGKDIRISETELLECINKVSHKWNISQQVEVFIWWNKSSRSSLSKLLKTQKNEWLSYNDECYFLIGNFGVDAIPDWVRVPAIKCDYQDELFKQSERNDRVIEYRTKDNESHISRIIYRSQAYPTVQFKYRDRSNIISAVNSAVDTYDKAVEFVKWLWKNYRHEQNWMPPGDFKYNFPCTKDNFRMDSELFYFGADYGNPLAEKLFGDEFRPFPPCYVFFVSGTEIQEFKEFIRKFGVKDYPEIAPQRVYPKGAYHYEYCREIEKSDGAGASSYFSIEYTLPYINHLEDILSKLSTSEIVEWIIRDSALNSYLSTPFYFSNANIIFSGNLQRYNRQYIGKIKNYILEVFNETKWVEVGEKRYSPREILQNYNARNNNKFADVVPVIGEEYLKDIAVKINESYELVYDVFMKFNFCSRVTDLCSEDFYGLMLKLPSMDFQTSSDLSKTIYRIIEQPSFNKIYGDSANKTRFSYDGQVLVKYHGKLQFYPAKEAYLPSSKMILRNSFYVVDKGQRTNNENFVRLFGCKEYNREYKINKNSISVSAANNGFQEYFHEFKRFAAAYGERNENIQRNAGNLRITLVSSISVTENDVLADVEEEYMCLRENQSNWYITVFGSDFAVNEISEIIEAIYSNIANTAGFDAGKIGELFRTEKESNRKFLIMKEFGSLTVIDDTSYQNDIKNSFIQTLKQINPDFPVDDIDIDFENFSDKGNSSRIISLFREIGTDVEDFRRAGFVYEINLVPYYKSKLSDFIRCELSNFRNMQFAKAISDNTLQSSFIDTVNRFREFSIDNIPSSVNFDVEKSVVSVFGEWRGAAITESSEDEYAANYERMNPEQLFEDEIANDKTVRQWIYFNDSDKFNSWLENQQKNAQQNTGEKQDPYSRFRSIVPQKAEVCYHPPRNENTSKPKSASFGVFTRTAAEKRQRNQKILGNKGELLIYNYLCQQVGKDKVTPRSEAYVELGIIKPGQAISGEYDISYIDNDGTEYFVEVKTGDGKSFIISPAELEFAKENADRYKLFLVFNIDDEEPAYIELPARFWDNPQYRRKEIIERIEFEF